MKNVGKFTLSLIQNKVTRDKDWNIKRASELLEKAYEVYKPDILALPELFNTPLINDSSDDLQYAEFLQDSKTLKMLSEFCKKKNVYLIGGSIPIKDEVKKNVIYNTCVCFDNKGEKKAIYRKIHLWDVDIPGSITYKESDTYSPGGLNDLLTTFDTPFARFGIGICYDVRFAELAYLLKSKKDIDVMVYPSAFPIVTGLIHWDILRRARAVDNQVWVAMISPSRNYEDKSYFQCYGSSSIINPFGEVTNEISYDEGIITSEIDLNLINQASTQIPIWKQKRNDLYELKCKKNI